LKNSEISSLLFSDVARFPTATSPCYGTLLHFSHSLSQAFSLSPGPFGDILSLLLRAAFQNLIPWTLAIVAHRQRKGLPRMWCVVAGLFAAEHKRGDHCDDCLPLGSSRHSLLTLKQHPAGFGDMESLI
jgi:hypothetical protein